MEALSSSISSQKPVKMSEVFTGVDGESSSSVPGGMGAAILLRDGGGVLGDESSLGEKEKPAVGEVFRDAESGENTGFTCVLSRKLLCRSLRNSSRGIGPPFNLTFSK